MIEAEEKLEAIRAKWGDERYILGTQASGNYIRQDDALRMIEILEENHIPFGGFETFRFLPDGKVQPDIMLSMDYYPEDGLKETPYAHGREHIKKLAASGEVFYYQIFYDVLESSERGSKPAGILFHHHSPTGPITTNHPAPVHQNSGKTAPINHQAAAKPIAVTTKAVPGVTARPTADTLATSHNGEINSILSSEQLKTLPPHLRKLALSGNPKDILFFCKEESFRLINGRGHNADSIKTGARLIRYGLGVAAKSNIHNHTVDKLIADMLYLKAWGIGTDKNLPDAVHYARHAGRAIHSYGPRLLKLLHKPGIS